MRTVVAAVGVLMWHDAWSADPPAALKPGPGADLASTACNTCHTSDYIIMNSPFLTAAQWQAEVTKMRSIFHAPIDDAAAAVIDAYLAANYGLAARP